MGTITPPSGWETQKPVEFADTKRKFDQLSQKYMELLNDHAKLITAIYNHDQDTQMRVYSNAMSSKLTSYSPELQEILAKSIVVPPFLKN